MPTTRAPRHGSMQVWPRVRAKRQYARIRSWAASKESKLLGFAGYKVGMTHGLAVNPRKNSITAGEVISMPLTVVACPPLKMIGVRSYKLRVDGWQLITQANCKPTKYLSRKISVPKAQKEVSLAGISADNCDRIMVIVATQPHLIGLKKTPEIFELALGGSVDEQLAKAKEYLDKDISLADVFGEGAFVDVRAVSKGKGTQGPVKRFGVSLRGHKSEKTIRGPGSRGGWSAQGHVMYRTAYSGQTGYQQRIQFNYQIMRIGKDGAAITAAGGYPHFGIVKGDYLLLKGSTPGPAKRMILMTCAARRTPNIPLATFNYVSLASKQGV